MAGGVLGEHGRRTPPDLVEVVHLPGGVVQELRGGLADHQIVVIGRAADELPDVTDRVAHLESQQVDEQVLTGRDVGAADHDMAELAGSDLTAAHAARGPLVASRLVAGHVVRGYLDRCLVVPLGDGDPGLHAAALVQRDDHVALALVLDLRTAQLEGDAVQVVLVVGSDADLDQPATGPL